MSERERRGHSAKTCERGREKGVSEEEVNEGVSYGGKCEGVNILGHEVQM